MTREVIVEKDGVMQMLYSADEKLSSGVTSPWVGVS